MPRTQTDLSDPRKDLLTDWISTLQDVPLDIATLRPAGVDASFRRYFRIDDIVGKSYIVADAPPPNEDVRSFINVAQLLSRTGVLVPHVFASDQEAGFMLLTDFGTTTYFDLFQQPDGINHAPKLYADAMDSLIKIQTHSKPNILPEYDRAFQLSELALFPQWYIGQHLGVTLCAEQETRLNKVFEQIVANTLAQPQVFVHRDYQSRNLMVMDKGNPGILDFQGARFGPITYDIISLLRDAYIEWDEEQVLDWVIRFWERARHANLPVSHDIDDFYRDAEFMGLQRHLKILGLFCRLHYRDNKSHYLKDLPLVLSYVRKTAQRYNTLIPLIRLLDEIGHTHPQSGYTF